MGGKGLLPFSFTWHPYLIPLSTSLLSNTKIIHHSCNFAVLRNSLLFKQKGYLNCYVAQLFMPVHKNAWVLLWRKVTHYNESNCCPPSFFILLMYSTWPFSCDVYVGLFTQWDRMKFVCLCGEETSQMRSFWNLYCFSWTIGDFILSVFHLTFLSWGKGQNHFTCV